MPVNILPHDPSTEATGQWWTPLLPDAIWTSIWKWQPRLHPDFGPPRLDQAKVWNRDNAGAGSTAVSSRFTKNPNQILILRAKSNEDLWAGILRVNPRTPTWPKNLTGTIQLIDPASPETVWWEANFDNNVPGLINTPAQPADWDPSIDWEALQGCLKQWLPELPLWFDNAERTSSDDKPWTIDRLAEWFINSSAAAWRW